MNASESPSKSLAAPTTWKQKNIFSKISRPNFCISLKHYMMTNQNRKNNLLGHFLNTTLKFERFSIKPADFRSFSEAMEYKKGK